MRVNQKLPQNLIMQYIYVIINSQYLITISSTSLYLSFMDYSSFSNPSSSNSTSAAKKKKKGVAAGMKLSTDPQSVAARERRHRISERFKILQSMVPGGSKMDTVSMLEQAIQYVKFLKAQVWLHQAMINLVDDNDVVDDAARFQVPNTNAAAPSLDFCDDCLVAECAQLGLPESWLSGGENWGFDASMQRWFYPLWYD